MDILGSKIQERINVLHLASFKQYLIHLVNNSEEINLFTKNFMLYPPQFYRDSETFNELERILSAYLIRDMNRLNIWLYPGHSGEEAYTIAFFFNELKKKYNNNFDFKIIASYYNKFAFEKALKGVYCQKELSNIPIDIIKNYFNKTRKKTGSDKFFSINDTIKNKVEYVSEAIVLGHSKLRKYDLIFCRNFMRFLIKDSQKKLLQMFENQSKQETLLILGPGETLQSFSTNFEPLNLKMQIYWKKSHNKMGVLKKPMEIQDYRVVDPFRKDELYIPAAHFGIVHSNQKSSKMAIYGLGSCIALILHDKKNDVHGMSHILFPDSNMRRSNEHLNTPHKYIDTSIKELQKELIKHGAQEDNIKAIVVGGAKIIDVEHKLDNALTIIKELKLLNIKIEKRDLGGKEARSIIYNAKDGSVQVKKEGNKDFIRL